MRLKRLSIQRQSDNTFALVAVIEKKGATSKKVLLSSGALHARDLQKEFVFYSKDNESLQADIEFHLHSLKEVV